MLVKSVCRCCMKAWSFILWKFLRVGVLVVEEWKGVSNANSVGEWWVEELSTGMISVGGNWFNRSSLAAKARLSQLPRELNCVLCCVKPLDKTLLISALCRSYVETGRSTRQCRNRCATWWWTYWIHRRLYSPCKSIPIVNDPILERFH